MSFLKKCPCLRPPDTELRVLDYRHSSLEHVPTEVFVFERTLEELYVDANRIKDLPRVRKYVTITPKTDECSDRIFTNIFNTNE